MAAGKKNKIEKWEAEIIKAMLASGEYTNQKILSYFTRPNRSLNQGRIVDIKKDRIFRTVRAASNERLEEFVKRWPQIDTETGLHYLNDELLLKSREAMLHAIQSYNNPRTYFRSEIFIVTAVIAWTYLLHAFFKEKNIDYRYVVKDKRTGQKTIAQTNYGAPKLWELEACLVSPRCPLDEVVKANLRFLLKIRHEIEHQLTRSIDDAISAKLQACCLNYNTAIKSLFGEALGIDNEFTVAIQLSTFNFDQQKALIAAQDLPANIVAAQKSIEDALTPDQFNDPRYAFRVAIVPKVVGNKGHADQVIEFVKEGSEQASAINRILLKETERKKFKPKQIVQIMRNSGFPQFNAHSHTLLWQKLDAKDPAKQFGVTLSDGQWYWYENWVERVRLHCEENKTNYRPKLIVHEQ